MDKIKPKSDFHRTPVSKGTYATTRIRLREDDLPILQKEAFDCGLSVPTYMSYVVAMRSFIREFIIKIEGDDFKGTIEENLDDNNDGWK